MDEVTNDTRVHVLAIIPRMSQIIPTAEPFFFLGDRSKPACLLIHGFTSTPKEMRWMGEFLNQQRYTCHGVRLAGHATSSEAMIRSRYTDWMASVEDGYNILRGFTDEIFLVGLSLGGMLSLLMSTQLDVKGVVALSTPYTQKFSNPLLPHAALLSRFKTYMPKGKGPPGSGWFDPAAWMDHISYPQNPVLSLGELYKLLHPLQVALPKVNVPVLLIHSKDDTYVLPENMELIFVDLKNASDKTKIYVRGSGHVVTRDAARLQVFEATLKFIQRVESGSK